MMSSARIPMPEGEIEAFCRKWTIAEPRFFGSVLREDFGPESDIDVLYALAPGVHWPWGGYGEMTDELERILGRKVDLVERAAVEQSDNYIRRRSILSGEPPVDRDAAHLLDMLIAARRLVRLMEGHERGGWDDDPALHDAVLFVAGQLGRAARRVSSERRAGLSDIPWKTLLRLDGLIMPSSEPFLLPHVRELVPESLPSLIAALEPAIPPEE